MLLSTQCIPPHVFSLILLFSITAARDPVPALIIRGAELTEVVPLKVLFDTNNVEGPSKTRLSPFTFRSTVLFIKFIVACSTNEASTGKTLFSVKVQLETSSDSRFTPNIPSAIAPVMEIPLT